MSGSGVFVGWGGVLVVLLLGFLVLVLLSVCFFIGVFFVVVVVFVVLGVFCLFGGVGFECLCLSGTTKLWNTIPKR